MPRFDILIGHRFVMSTSAQDVPLLQIDVRLKKIKMKTLVCEWVILGGVLLSLAACGGGGGSSSGPSANAGAASSSTASAVGVTAVDVATSANRVLLRLQAVGNTDLSTPLPTIFDTGSAGLVLDALSLFPSANVTSNGFVFPPGQSSFQYNGITVTNLQGTVSFGSGSLKTTFNGNVGYATIKVGGLVTQSMPIFFFFNAVDQNGNPKIPQTHGIFGVHSGVDSVVVGNAASPAVLSICDTQSLTTCHLVSPFRYFNYAAGVSAGFKLSATPLNSACDANTWLGCTNVPLLTVGLTLAVENGASVNAFACPGNQPSGLDAAGLPLCQPEILTTVSVAGQTFQAFALFDSGNPIQSINVPAANSTGFPSPVAQGTPVSVTMLSGFVYAYTVGAINTVTSTTFTLNTTQRNVFGLDYFANHGFFINYANKTEGFY
jgi:hypothetical protein